MSGRWDSDGWPNAEPRRPGAGEKRAKGRKPFGATWWGAAWVDAIEHRASLDPNRLPRGRSYARSGQVDQIVVDPGNIRCLVQGSRPEPYEVRIRVRTFTDGEWERVLDSLAAQAGHTAALLDGEIVPEVADDVRGAGVDLLPGPGEVQPRCTCPDWADPCKHAAAACYLLADELDKDPFVVFLLRGRERAEVMAGLRARRRGPAAAVKDRAPDGQLDDDPGVVAREAWARCPDPLPRVPSPPRLPGRPAVLAVDPPAASLIGIGTLRALAADAAVRAWGLAVGARTTPIDDSVEHDIARRAAAMLDGPGHQDSAAIGGDLTVLARRAGLPPRDLLRRALAWRHGGQVALDTLLHAWDPSADQLHQGRALLGPSSVTRRNRVTAGDRQLRLARDGRWYPFRKNKGSWDPDGAPLD